MRRRIFGAGAVSAITGAALVATVALAAPGVETKVKVGLDPSPSGDAIAGKLKTDKPCKGDRTVKVTYKDKSAGIKDVLGTDKTNEKGKFSVDVPADDPYGEGGFAAPGDYIAKAKKKKVEIDGERVTCKAGEGTYEHRA